MCRRLGDQAVTQTEKEGGKVEGKTEKEVEKE